MTSDRTEEEDIKEFLASLKVPLWRRIVGQVLAQASKYGPHLFIAATWGIGAWLIIPDSTSDSAQWVLSTEAQALAALGGILLVGFTLTATAGTTEESRLRRLSKRYLDLLVLDYGEGPAIEQVRGQVEELLTQSSDVIKDRLFIYPNSRYKTGRDAYIAVCVLCNVSLPGDILRFDDSFERIGWKDGRNELAFAAHNQVQTPLQIMRFIYNFFCRARGAVSISPSGKRLQSSINYEALHDDLEGALRAVDKAEALRGGPLWITVAILGAGMGVSLLFLAGTNADNFHLSYMYISTALAFASLSSIFELLRRFVVAGES